MSIEDDIRLLERVQIFSVLGREPVRNLAIGAQTLILDPGDVLFEAGDPLPGTWVVVAGTVEYQAADGRVLATMRAGTVIADMAALMESRAPARAVAPEGATLMVVSRALFLRMLDGFPEAALALRDMVVRRGDQLARDLERVRLAMAVSAIQE
jgi:CRP-like cAMP-binding protein